MREGNSLCIVRGAFPAGVDPYALRSLLALKYVLLGPNVRYSIKLLIKVLIAGYLIVIATCSLIIASH